MDVSHHGGACYVDEFDLEQSNGNGNGVDADPAGKLNHLAKKSPNELESEVYLPKRRSQNSHVIGGGGV